MLTTTKPPKCRHCKERTEGTRLHDACIPGFLAALNAKKAAARQRVERKADREKRQSFKRPSKWEQECREIVQKIARLRDRNDGCISCHMGANYGGAWHGSHFRPAGNNSAVQFHLWNIHKACAQCNLFKGGNIAAYRPRLVEKIGADRVEWLESQTQITKRDIPYLIRFKAVMGKRLRRMEKRLTN